MGGVSDPRVLLPETSGDLVTSAIIQLYTYHGFYNGAHHHRAGCAIPPTITIMLINSRFSELYTFNAWVAVAACPRRSLTARPLYAEPRTCA